MRVMILVLSACGLVSTGCASLVASSETASMNARSREEARQKFGQPIESGTGPTGDSYDVFRVHEKFRDSDREWALLGSSLETFGLAELVLFPWEVMRSWYLFVA